MKFNKKLYFSKKISNNLKKNIWLKFENLNLTGSHKDREVINLINLAIKKNYKKIGCASTGNLAISLAFFSKLRGLLCYIWLNYKNKKIANSLEDLGAKVYIKNTSLKKLYLDSDKFFKKNKIFSTNPAIHDEKLIANRDITLEILKENKKIDCIISCVNNGSHILGLSKKFRKKQFIGVYSKSNLAKSINAASMIEFKKSHNRKFIKLIKANDQDILRGFKILFSEGIYAEGSSCAVIGVLNKIKKYKNICCILSGSAHKNLQEIQKIFSKTKINIADI